MPSSSINAITRMSATLKDLFIYIYDSVTTRYGFIAYLDST